MKLYDPALDPWYHGDNRRADESLSAAYSALKQGDAFKCFAAVREAMEGYGWRYHSDRKARSLWKRWEELAESAKRDPAAFARAEGKLNYVDLYHEVTRSVLLDKDRRMRRNLPPETRL